MNINSLAISVSEMSHNDLLNYITKIRKRRRLPPPVKKTSKRKKESNISIDSLISCLPNIDKESLIKLFEGGE